MDDPSFSVEVNTNTQEILLAASNHDLAALKPFLRIPGNASVQDPETGFTPLHAAIAACEKEENGEEVDIEKAKEVVRELFLSGAIWNDLDSNNETPGCLAGRLGRKELYELCVEAGVRAEMLLGLMGKYEVLDSESEDEEEESVDVDAINGDEKKDVNSADYLASDLKFSDDKLLDADNNGVMMAWETSIMERSVASLLPPGEDKGKRILNIGFGMGIIDTLFAETQPAIHHIIEAHPAVLAKLKEEDHPFGPKWEASSPEQGAYKTYEGKWQDVLPTLLETGYTYDAIYFDTFGEDYSALKLFFTEFVPGLLDENGRFGFFNGLGADRRVCYDVYTRVVECDLVDAGLEVEWEDVEVGKLGEEGEGEWEGVRRRYWTLEGYRLPTCRFLS
ncbi:S-adenosyl-L-methionine-dependent methyltransferase [Glarea lozoyensis ATCC 20868]|uniref:Arginine N-methyltransferase 2 n=2 Tax=Glarea lozoyensis TaxID=101852 RepID=S3D2V1_GLAL2|nr:S-adenosyl-L-methionine-dependent methyltransferase [Glarea lozoyensis ATCC 20868]EHL02822.1 putative Arginine N-methyltransferase 2 [Glarea lozoyensis 74030]EPE26371.1 S-adenosyl-L-methionine-dependent methyltransferase [Glarea lozoyensis ATCC 20868]